MWYTIFEHLGRGYQGIRVIQDSGFWLVNVAQLTQAWESFVITRAVRARERKDAK